MKTLHTSLRVTDLEVSLVFYAALGYQQVGRVSPEAGTTLVMLKLLDDAMVTLELLHRPDDGAVEVGAGISHRAVQVEDLEAARATLSGRGLEPGAVQRPGGQHGPRACWLTDPDGLTAADFT